MYVHVYKPEKEIINQEKCKFKLNTKPTFQEY